MSLCFEAWRQYTRVRQATWACRTRVATVDTMWDMWVPRWCFATWRISFCFTAGRDDVQAFIVLIRIAPQQQMEVALISVSLLRGIYETMVLVDF